MLSKPEDKEPFSDESSKYLAKVTPRHGDPTYSVLKAHLVLEELLYDFLLRHFNNPAALQDARFTFAQTLAIARAFCLRSEKFEWLWEALKRLNSLRNHMAHKVVVNDLQKRSDELAEFIFLHAEVEKLSPIEMTEENRAELQARHLYSKLDLAMAALHGYLRGYLSIPRN